MAIVRKRKEGSENQRGRERERGSIDVCVTGDNVGTGLLQRWSGIEQRRSAGKAVSTGFGKKWACRSCLPQCVVGVVVVVGGVGSCVEQQRERDRYV